MKKAILSCFILLALGFVSFAIPTTVIVRVRAKDAKFIGTGMGGAFVVIKNKMTGEVLAKGLTSGSSGSTPMLLQNPISRHQALTDTGTAKFEAVIDIDDPVFVVVEVTAPVTKKNASVNGSLELWVIPGMNIDGDGLIIELPGLIVDVLQPTTHEILSLDSLRKTVFTFRASVTMLCGCTITKNGIWNADSTQVVAVIKKDGREIMSKKLLITSKPNIFEGTVKISNPGMYQISIWAFDHLANNTGLDETNFVVQ